MNTNSDSSTSQYRIGKVSKLTGLSPDTLRIWERRYEAVIPERSDAGGRLYSPRDIARLKLMKKLVDGGDSIGEVARLSMHDLEARARETGTIATIDHPGGPLRLIIIGDALAARLGETDDGGDAFDIVARFASTGEFEVSGKEARADILIIEQPTLQMETTLKLPEWIARTSVVHTVLVYRFASEETLGRLPKARCSALRAPLDAATLMNHCLSIMRPYSGDQFDSIEPGQEAPPARRYDDESLVKIASLSPTIKCECPRHLAELISSLIAFEQYSSECESRNRKDAELHAYLGITTSQARHMIENALAVVIEAEKIEI